MKIWKFYLPPFLWAGLIFLNSSRPHLSIPKFGFFQNIDKIAHFGVYFILGYLIIRAISSGDWQKVNWKKSLVVILMGALYGLSDEIHQTFVPGRTADIADWIADFLGVVSGHFFYSWFNSKIRGVAAKTDLANAAEMEER